MPKAQKFKVRKYEITVAIFDPVPKQRLSGTVTVFDGDELVKMSEGSVPVGDLGTPAFYRELLRDVEDIPLSEFQQVVTWVRSG